MITITSYDSGHWVIPAFDLPGTNIVTDSLEVDVQFIPMKPQDPLRDIKDIIPVKATIPWLLMAFSGAVLVVLVVLVLIRTCARAKGGGFRKERSLHWLEPPYEEALGSLEALNMPVASADIKPYYSRGWMKSLNVICPGLMGGKPFSLPPPICS